MWESVGLLFLYLISGYINKRKKDQKNRIIESDPDWDIPKEEEGIDNLLLNPFSQKETLDVVEDESSNSVKNIDQAQVLNDEEVRSELIKNEPNPDEAEVITILNKEKKFEDKIYH